MGRPSTVAGSVALGRVSGLGVVIAGDADGVDAWIDSTGGAHAKTRRPMTAEMAAARRGLRTARPDASAASPPPVDFEGLANPPDHIIEELRPTWVSRRRPRGHGRCQ